VGSSRQALLYQSRTSPLLNSTSTLHFLLKANFRGFLWSKRGSEYRQEFICPLCTCSTHIQQSGTLETHQFRHNDFLTHPLEQLCSERKFLEIRVKGTLWLTFKNKHIKRDEIIRQQGQNHPRNSAQSLWWKRQAYQLLQSHRCFGWPSFWWRWVGTRFLYTIQTFF